MKIDGFIPTIMLTALLLIATLGDITHAQDAADWMPDTNLRQAIREEIGLPDAIPLEKRHLHLLARFDAHDKGIADITGIEFAINLTFFRISMNPITDLRPLAGLTQLEELHCWAVNPQRTFFDLQPLANLTNLTVLSLSGAGVTDISPLAGLINLRLLHVSHNQIVDFSPLAGLTNLRELHIQENYGRDFTPIASLNLTDFKYDEVCEIPPGGVPALERIQNRTFPSVALWPVTNAAEDAQYDFFWGRYFPVRSKTRATSAIVGKVKEAIISHRSLMEMHPNLIILFPMAIYGAEGDDFLPDADVWLRDTNGERVFKLSRNSAGSWREYQLDFVKPHVQDKIVERIVGIAKCGLYDGIAIDAFTHNATGFGSRHLHPATDAEIIAAITRILREARKRVRDDFLIVVNANRTKPIPYAEYVNGSVMEPGQDYPGGYTYRGLQELDDTLIWNDKNLRSPQINWSSVILIEDQPPDSPDNLQWVRLFTTRGIILADAYVEVHHTPSHVVDKKELWYSFWDAPLGHPIGEKGQLYNGREGLFLREFTNGWAVYNRSGKAQDIQLPEEVSGWASGVKDQRRHTLADLDGEIYLKSESRLETPPTTDVNADGIVNILDLVVVANAFGKDTPDVNGDGTVNVLDLVAVANAFE